MAGKKEKHTTYTIGPVSRIRLREELERIWRSGGAGREALVEECLENPIGISRPLRKSKPITYGEYNSYYTTSAVMTLDRDVLLFYRVGSDHTSNDGKIMMVKYSNGVWETPRLFASDPVYDVRNPISGVSKYGRIVVMYAKYDAEARVGIGRYLKYSDDDGETWSGEIHLPLTGAIDYQNSVGNILLDPQTRRMFYATENPDYTGFVFFQSVDGVSWSQVSTFADFSAIGGNVYEPCLTAISSLKYPTHFGGNIRIFCSIRHHKGKAIYIWMTYSDDRGSTWSDPVFLPEIKGSYAYIFPYGLRLGLLARSRPSQGLDLYATENPYGIGFSKQGSIFSPEPLFSRVMHSGYISCVNQLDGSVMLIFPIEPEYTVAQEKGTTLLAGLYYMFLDPREFSLEPQSLALYDTSGNLLAGQTLDAGSITSQPLSVFGRRNKTIYFQADQAGTLDIEVLGLSGNWRTYESVAISADTLEPYPMTGDAVLCRVTFTPSAYPATIDEAEVVLG